MKKFFLVSLACIAFLFVVVMAVFVYASNMAMKGRDDVYWLVRDMWGNDFLEGKSNVMRSTDLMLIKSLSLELPSAREEVENYLERNICKDASRECREYILIAANAQAGDDGIDEARKLLALAAVRAETTNAGECQVRYELTYLNVILQVLKNDHYREGSKARAIKTIEKIKADGGIQYTLRTAECVRESKVAPEIFRKYVSMAEKIMSRGDQGMKWSAALIRQEFNK